ncbi:cadmium-translocating P-type ATPase [Shewanella oneidensis MR-1]|uniref:P-type Cu(2+) transporter n=1 Tax=Shewanella oneidensis (strain ATCC 700550 / JCM 31522 / CIP 106686 / LMG 19005 / NCIMB 14063 / MR-1) TaxID=211586 RepID=Q8EEM0_SHEON|nr:heavy metal translocating P-type ATPase metal-binding domain-containing protein [Shewanella oneidensis]AAN55393.1 Cbb3-type cytochrome oxidase-associated copper translocating P-ATPase CcoI [Shewanella oneidensis MR-1]MDX5995944.1 heavy metal translocating P-type ATPase metal-binding domain-containing protein [Shewanella oneidensis]MEE2029524.1 putative copper-importing P-type ATPase A [Shewanella oneidensis]QKG96904.1 cadmium-translocating P-type ATPase [Shewanella oneidensis MR-1]
MTHPSCFHCNEPVLTGTQFVTQINDRDELMCCPGCQAVSQAIVDAGLLSYYKFRTEPGNKQTALVPEALNQFSAYDLPEVQQDFVHSEDNSDSVSLSIDGITCAACAWLIEHKVKQLSGVRQVMVNSTTQRAMISWDKQQVKLSDILGQISRIGYQAAPYQVDEQELTTKQNSRKFLLRLGLAGFATMQVMMFALALYTGYFTDLDVQYRDYFRWVSMIFATPVVLYSAQPFYFSAIRTLLSGKLNMDVSVSIAIGGAFTASCFATVNGTGEVYFESVSMFTFFLLLGRYFEQKARQKASVSSSNLHKLVPLTAHLVNEQGQEEIPAKKLRLGDIILVKPGEMVAADGCVVEGHSSINEAMLTGEQMPIDKPVDSQVFAGTINLEQPIKVKVTALGQDQLVAEIIRLQELASNTKPAVAMLADKLSRYFSGTILTIATITYFVWLQISPEDAFWVTLSVLVATCPCALALATPTAVTCATAIFTRLGIITRKAGVFEKLPQIKHVIFDKTGTLTCGTLSVSEVKCHSHLAIEEVLAIAAALETGSLHPIATAFAAYLTPDVVANQVHHEVGFGVKGLINGTEYRIGNAQFTGALVNPEFINQQIWLAWGNDDSLEVLATIEIKDNIRVDSKETVGILKQQGCRVSIASGDSSGHVHQLAKALGITDVHSGLTPADKLALVKKLQQSNPVVMFGDGINDAPVLAGADLSVAMGSGSAIAKNSADLILLGDHLSRFTQAVRVAKLTTQIIRQNLAWALGYNALILPLAVTGHVAPYIAAIGMSASSLIVVGNSLRLLRIKI